MVKTVPELDRDRVGANCVRPFNVFVPAFCIGQSSKKALGALDVKSIKGALKYRANAPNH